MKPCKVLFITADFSQYVQRSFHYFDKELSELVQLFVWHRDGHIQDILDQLPERPDFILLNDFRPRHCPAIDGLETLDIPLGAIVHDTHYNIHGRKRFINSNNIQHIFSIYRDSFLQLFPEFANRMHWFPHFVDGNVFCDYKLNKDIDFLLLGSTEAKVYPFRKLMLDRMKSTTGFYHRRHPGYHNFSKIAERKVLIDESYARVINRAKVFLSCDSIYHFPVRKYYEVLACRTLLLSSASKELLDLGFIPDIHYVEITEHNFEEKAHYYLKNCEERERIADAGYKLVHERHTVKHRAQEFVDILHRILGL